MKLLTQITRLSVNHQQNKDVDSTTFYNYYFHCCLAGLFFQEIIPSWAARPQGLPKKL